MTNHNFVHIPKVHSLSFMNLTYTASFINNDCLSKLSRLVLLQVYTRMAHLRIGENNSKSSCMVFSVYPMGSVSDVSLNFGAIRPQEKLTCRWEYSVSHLLLPSLALSGRHHREITIDFVCLFEYVYEPKWGNFLDPVVPNLLIMKLLNSIFLCTKQKVLNIMKKVKKCHWRGRGGDI